MSDGVPSPVVAVIQARMGSTRLPGKVLADIEGQPMLARVVERARRARNVERTVVATTTDPADEPVVALCAARGYEFTRGHPTDVLDRYLQAARETAAQVVVRITADCPLIDPEVVDRTVEAFLAAWPEVDYASNRIVRTYPIGLDVEVVRREALERAAVEAREPYHREHVTPYFYEAPGRFRVVSVEAGGDYGRLRWTVDTPEDLAFVREVYRRFGGRDDFGWREVLDLLAREPDLIAINAHVRQKGYREVG